MPDYGPRGCNKGLRHARYMYGKQRVLYPMKRVGKRGEGKWQRISWDQATREIAEKGGVSEGALYRHYKGKDELALVLFQETHKRLGEMLFEAMSTEGTLEEKVNRAVTAYCQLADEDFLLFSFHLVSINRYIPYDKKRHDDPVSIIETVIAGLMESGTIPKADPALKAAMTLGLVMQAGQNKIYSRLPGPLSQHAPALSRAVMAVLTTA